MGRRLGVLIATLLIILTSCEDFASQLEKSIRESNGLDIKTIWNITHKASINLAKVNGSIENNGIINRTHSTPYGDTFLKVIGDYALVAGTGYTTDRYATVLKFDISNISNILYQATIIPEPTVGWERRTSNSVVRDMTYGSSNLVQIATSTSGGSGDIYLFNYTSASGSATMTNFPNFLYGITGLYPASLPPVRDYIFTSEFVNFFKDASNYRLVDCYELSNNTLDVLITNEIINIEELYREIVNQGSYNDRNIYYLLVSNEGSSSVIKSFKFSFRMAPLSNFTISDYKSITMPGIVNDLIVKKGTGPSDTFIHGATNAGIYSFSVQDVMNESNPAGFNFISFSNISHLAIENDQIAAVSSDQHLIALFGTDGTPTELILRSTTPSYTPEDVIAVEIKAPYIFTVEEEENSIFNLKFHAYEISSYTE